MQGTEAVDAFYSYMEGMFMHFKYLHASLFVFCSCVWWLMRVSLDQYGNKWMNIMPVLNGLM